MRTRHCIVTLMALTTASASQSSLAGDAAHPAVVELYQSQGCSSCPAADILLNKLVDRPDVLALMTRI